MTTNGSDTPAPHEPAPEEALPPQPDPQLTRLTRVAGGLLLIAVLAVLHIGRPVLLPLAAALLLSFVLRPIPRALERLRIPLPVGALLVVVLVGGAMVYGVYSLREPAAQWIKEAPRSFQQLQERLHVVKKSLDEVQAATEEVAKLAQEGGEELEKVVVQSDMDSGLLRETQEAAAGIFTTLVLLFFILGWGERLYRNLVNALPRFRDQRQAVLIAQEVQGAITAYLGTITIINVLLGVVTGVVLYLMGMPNPVLWGVLAGVFNFVPYLGPAITAVILGFVAVLSYPTIAEALLVPAAFLVITSLEGYIITPTLVGQRLTLNPLLIFVSLVFWFWMWGVVGALLTVPFLVCVKAALDRVDAVKSLAQILD